MDGEPDPDLLLGLKRYPGVVIYITDDIATWLIRHVGWLQIQVGGRRKSSHARLFGAITRER